MWQVDPQLEWLMSVRMRKPWHQWVEQLFSDESVEAQVCSFLPGYDTLFVTRVCSLFAGYDIPGY